VFARDDAGMKDSRLPSDVFLLLPFLILLLFLTIVHPEKLIRYPILVEWSTLASLAGLLIITTSIEESGYFRAVAAKILERMGDERKLAFYLVLLSCLLSSFLTNDIALFIVVPLTLSLQEIMKKDVGKLIIFEAMAVNVGSLLTPIGNPQNLFLWHQWGLTFLKFIAEMLPLFLLLFILLLAFVMMAFPSKKIDFHGVEERKYSRRMFFPSLLLLAAYVFSLRMGWEYYAFAAVILIYLSFSRRTFLEMDWFLLLLFLIMFIDFRLLTEMEAMRNIMESIDAANPSGIFVLSASLSQMMSNVPASIFVAEISHQWKAIAYGVNVGGNGLVIASLANIIALRLARDARTWLNFHKYSIPYFLISSAMAYLIFFR